MAYMNQERKAKLAAELEKVVPAGWKYSLAVRHHSTIVMTISEAPVDLIRSMKPSEYFDPTSATEVEVNRHRIDIAFSDTEVAKTFRAIFTSLNTGNHDRSDTQTDYFDVGWYVEVSIGRWDRPFKYKAPAHANA